MAAKRDFYFGGVKILCYVVTMPEFTEAYQKLLKENAQLHAKVAYLADASARAQAKAADYVNALHARIDKFETDVENLIRAHSINTPGLRDDFDEIRPMRIRPTDRMP